MASSDMESWSDGDRYSDISISDLPEVRPHPPRYLFNNAAEFAERHGNGTQTEFVWEKAGIKSFNKKLQVFYAWPIVILHDDGLNRDILFLVQTGPDDSMLPKEGENCTMKFPRPKYSYNEDDGPKKFSRNTRFLCRPASRVDNPCSFWGVKDDYWERCMAFEVTVATKTSLPCETIISPKIADQDFSRIPRPKSLEVPITFELRVSNSTKDAELNALNKFVETLGPNTANFSPAMNYRRAAFRFLLDFRPTSHSSLFRTFPHLADPFRRPDAVPKELMRMLEAMNTQQKAAYKNGLSEIPNRICFVAGGPGAGKHELVIQGSPTPSRNQVLYLIDINRSATDVANKLFEMFKKLGLKRNVIRMYCWSDEMNSTTQNLLETQKQELYYRISRKEQGETSEDKDGPLAKYDKEADNSSEMQLRKLSLPIMRTGPRSKSHYKDEKANRTAPTLEEAVMAFYEEHKDTSYIDLQNLSCVRNGDLEALRNHLVGQVYHDFLKVVDVVVTTPVTAAKFSRSLQKFDPKLVIFDEAPHARELSIMIPIANFNPVAWIFTGDHRQTKPYGSRPNINKHVLQLRTSTMERAFNSNPNMTSLLINHRARGNLHEPASTMFYGSKMIPAIRPGAPGAIPPSTEYLRQKYIMAMKNNKGPQVSRLVTVLEYAEFDREQSRVQGSLFNRAHQDWVERLVIKLIKDPMFVQTNHRDRGTILIMSPYKRAVLEYRKMINDQRRTPSGLYGCVVEARTVDTSQGHEADVVILDFVSDWVTNHLQDPNRLCVALTRARQAEFILLHTDLEDKLEGLGQFANGPLAEMLEHCKDAGEFVRIVKRTPNAVGISKSLGMLPYRPKN
ncbi:hypothetical protein J7T55_009824 [Diaporthe amygdali]|uniref:uncharacterized protein n=1 Tax=Phomopsis amygdali TaxID=1214568 RepID=UPI0022FEF172|nr:uncharacterized protein J7T55_009824 [Diaporthe amygdali]KAJ0116674.1 hypothetical protein J7T55_009824 [Diaporthe amygdali]